MKHGYNAYARQRCRPACDECKAAKRDYMRQLRLKKKIRQRFYGRQPIPGIKHGYSGYQNEICRCDVCVTAKAKADVARYRNPNPRDT